MTQPPEQPRTAAGRALHKGEMFDLTIEEDRRRLALAIEAKAAAPDPVASRGLKKPPQPTRPDPGVREGGWPWEERGTVGQAPDPVASPPEAVRLLGAVLDQFDYWSSDPRPAVDGGTVRLHKFGEVQPEMERVLAEARRYLASTEEGTARAGVANAPRTERPLRWR